ncbi:MAG: type II toxin-antitoxin system VapB family antitoxin [Acidobacteriota bacterium]|nr:type II toxin-antitoxin system VapB family antitoxin [Acidobacteriota bacterium]
MPVLNIKDPETHALAAELAKLSGQTMTQSVKEAIKERLAKFKIAKWIRSDCSRTFWRWHTK